MSKNYRKKPVVVQAVKWNGMNLSEICEFCEGKARVEYYDAGWKAGACSAKADIFIDTLEGTHHASIGDYIIRGVNGEFYPCKPDIFEKTYELVEDDAADSVKDQEKMINAQRDIIKQLHKNRAEYFREFEHRAACEINRHAQCEHGERKYGMLSAIAVLTELGMKICKEET